MLGYTLAGLGTMLFGVSWIVTGASLYRGKLAESPSPAKRRLFGAALVLWGLALMFWGSRMTHAGMLYDVDCIRNYSGAPRDCSDIVIYTLRGCPWCAKAMDELKRRGLRYREVEYYRNMPDPQPKMPDETIPRFFPQIWVGGRNMGGYSEMSNWIDNCN